MQPGLEGCGWRTRGDWKWMILGRVTIEFLGFQGLREGWQEEELASDRLKVPLMFPIINSGVIMRLQILFIFISSILTSACQSAACAEHEKRMAECEDVDIDCEESLSKQCYGDITVTLRACNCDSFVYGAVCEAGITDSLETIENGTECGEWY